VSGRSGRRLALLLAAVSVASACSTPIGVVSAGRQAAYHELTASVLSTGTPSATSLQEPRRIGLAERLADQPEEALAELRGSGDNLSRDRLYALAELSFAHGDRSGKREYYLAAAVYAYAFLMPSKPSTGLIPIDPRNRLAADLYNLGLSLGLRAPEGEDVILEAGDRPLPFGRLDLTVDAERLRWSVFRFSRFIAVSEFEVRGLRNRYRQAGLGVPVAAEVAPVGEGLAVEVARKRIPPRIKVPVTAFVRLENVEGGIASGTVKGRIEIYPADTATSLDIGGLKVPLELEPTATLAYMLEGAPVWDTEIAGFLKAERPVLGDGLVMMHPYRPGRIPVVLIHGTASSPARWAEMMNELQNDPVLRGRVQFWLFTYNTSNPILLSAKRLRDSLRQIRVELDPEGRDPALGHMVLIGHSQGGLLTRLMVTESGNRFWDNVSEVPLSELQISPETRELLQTAMFFEPLPFVDTVVFIATPHRGSFRATGFVLNIIRRLVTLPITVIKGIGELATQNPQLFSRDAMRSVPTAVDNMSPGHPFTKTLSASPIAPGVKVYSIVAVLGEGPLTGQTDGVVRYDSAHLDGVGTEKVVRSSHSTQGEPVTIEEVRRILREVVAGPQRAPPAARR
jgi:pimeloyl-ACP methyl ester carboxylesterase